MISVMMFSNLVQLQENFVTSTDYFRESYVFKVQQCLAVVWLASLRKLGYSCGKIQSDLSIIFLALFLQRALALILMSAQQEDQEEKLLIIWNMVHCLVTACVAKYRPEYYSAHHICFFTVALCGKLHFSNLLIAPTVIFLVTWYIVNYRPEYYCCYHICMAMVSHAMQDNDPGAPTEFVTLTVIATTFIFVFFVRYLQSSPKMVYGKMVRDRMINFRTAWKESSERDPDALAEITEMCKEISGVLIQQRHDALQMLSLFGKVRAYLEERVGRWSLRERKGKVKARQKCTDIDLLIANAGATNEPFQDLVSEICFAGCSFNQSAGLEFVAGPVKQPRRTLEKLVRRHRRDVGCLTDLVRCTVISDSLENVKDFLRLLYSKSVVGLDTSPEEEGKCSKQRPGEQLGTGDELFRITAIENRFDPSYEDETSMGYRDLALNIEVGWIVSSDVMSAVSFQKVRDWRRLNCITHICEIRIRTRSGHACALEGHQNYLVFRGL